MSVTKHSISCHCHECQRFNNLSGETWKLTEQMLQAAEAGKEGELETIREKLELKNEEIRLLGEKLNR